MGLCGILIQDSEGSGSRPASYHFQSATIPCHPSSVWMTGDLRRRTGSIKAGPILIKHTKSCNYVLPVRYAVLSPQGKFLHRFGSKGSGDGQLNNPWSITFDRNDSKVVYVADGSNNRISMFTIRGEFLRSFSSKGTADGQLHNPMGITIDKNSFIRVSDHDHSNNRIVIF